VESIPIEEQNRSLSVQTNQIRIILKQFYKPDTCEFAYFAMKTNKHFYNVVYRKTAVLATRMKIIYKYRAVTLKINFFFSHNVSANLFYSSLTCVALHNIPTKSSYSVFRNIFLLVNPVSLTLKFITCALPYFYSFAYTEYA
jgi:hypothetical protein